MVFNFDNYEGRYVMHCKTEEEAKDFCRVMNNSGRTWRTGELYTKLTHWGGYKTGICYSFNMGRQCDMSWYKYSGYTILEWGDFMEKEFTKADLKEGIVGITRKGKRYIYICGKFRNCDGTTYWGSDADLNNDFTSVGGHAVLDFMRICITSAETLGDWCKDEYLTTVWERKEVTEMTLEEIKDRLGISGELKIVEWR